MMLKKVIALLVLLIISTSVFAVSAQELDVLLFEEFGNYNSGLPIGWTTSPLAVLPAKIGGQNAARLTSTEALYDANMQQAFSPALTGKVVLEATVWMPDVIYRRALFTMKDSSNRENQTIMFNSNGYITVSPGDKKVMIYRPEKIYHLQLLLDIDNKVYDLYINEKMMLQNMPIANQEISNLALLRFGQWDKNNAYFYIDDIFVYRSDKVLSSKLLKESLKVSFSDVQNSWAKEQIEYFADLKLLKKTEDGKFYPDRVITNAEMVDILYNVMRFPMREYINIFADVKKTDSYSSPLQALVDAGIVSGGQYYNPEKTATLEQAVMPLVEVYKYAKQKLPGDDTMNFKSLQDKGKWARDYMGQAKYLNLFKGIKDINQSKINGDMPVTRAHFIAMFKNLIAEMNKK